MSFTSLVADKTTSGSIKRWVNNSEVDSEEVLDEAQGLIFQTLRVREMRSLWSPAMAVGDSSKALPAGFLDPIGYLRDTTMLRYRLLTEDELMSYRIYDSNGAIQPGQPSAFAIFDEALQFDVKFDTATTLKYLYFKSPALLASDNETNWLTVRYRQLLRQACITKAYAFMRNWTAYSQELQVLSALLDRAGVEGDLSYRGADLDGETPHAS